MATVIINGVSYPDPPRVDIPKSPSGTMSFWDVTGATLDSAGKLRNGVKAVGPDGTLYTGSMTEKAAATITPSASSQSISADQYLAGAQTIEAVVCTNLTAANIKSGVTVKVGTSSDDDSVASVTGSLSSPTISQDGVTKVLSIS